MRRRVERPGVRAGYDRWSGAAGGYRPGHIPLEPPEAAVPGAIWLVEQTAETFTGQVVDRADFARTWGPRA
jgi:hypothetical protein